MFLGVIDHWMSEHCLDDLAHFKFVTRHLFINMN